MCDHHWGPPFEVYSLLIIYCSRKLQLDINDHIQNVGDDLMAQLLQIKTLIQNTQAGDHSNSTLPSSSTSHWRHTATLPDSQQRRSGTSVSHTLTTRRLAEKFEETIHHHPRFRSILPEVPIEDWCEAAALWIENVRVQLLQKQIQQSNM